jgi:tetratricopeptide (TPR) repeat protein
LIVQKIPGARVARALGSLIEQLPAGRPLSGLRIWADGSRVVVQDGAGCWNPETGQAVLDFEGSIDVGELQREADKVTALTEPADASGAAQARVEFERALELEDEDPMAACTCYGRAVELDPDLVDAYVNLGRIAHEAGQATEAVRLYRLALERTPRDPVIYFNLGLAVEDTGSAETAARHYEKALELAPDFADAHFNLAGLCEELDRPQDALRHYAEYRRLTQDP